MLHCRMAEFKRTCRNVGKKKKNTRISIVKAVVFQPFDSREPSKMKELCCGPVNNQD